MTGIIPGFQPQVAVASGQYRGIRVLLTVVAALLCVGSNSRGADDDTFARQKKRIDMIARISPSVVCVMPPGGQGGGSGVLISADGYAVSNYHVTSGSGNFMKCGLNDGRVYDAVIVGVDPTGDVALIKLLGRDDFPACTPGNSDLVKVGDEVVALGNPFLLASDFTPTVTYGIVSGIRRYQYPAGTFLEYTDCIQIDASINPGNSGGPLFDINGNWIGINGRASFEKRGRVNSGAAYAISVRQVQLFIDQLKSGRIVDHGRTEFTVATYGRTVEVQQVSELSEAWRRGMRPGDELVSFAGRVLTSANDFKNILGIFPAGTRVPLVYQNDEGSHRVTVRLNRLHGFDEVPQLPEERQPRPDEPEKRPDGHPPAETEESDVVPDQYAHLFEAKRGYTNFYFNRIRTSEILERLRQQLPSESDSTSTWQMAVTAKIDANEYSGRLTVSPRAAGLDITGLNPALQSLDRLDASAECLPLYGLLFGALQWHRLFQNDPGSFSDVVYHGTEELLPSGRQVHVLIVLDGGSTSRWYFEGDSPLPTGVDVQISAGTDEGRLRFDHWNTDTDIPMPGRIGVVDAATEQIRWITIDSVERQKKATETASVWSNRIPEETL